MRPVMLVQLACWADGRLCRDAGAVQIDALSTDTRTLKEVADRKVSTHSPSHSGRGCPKGAGEGASASRILFVALKGDNFDGHDHVAEAARLGASAALVSREIDIDLPQIVVENTEHALARLAAKLQSLRQTRVIALTGSNGKTTVKQLTMSILQQAGTAYCNPGNHNNQIGLPLAVIDAPEDAEFAVYEMGAGQPGDIAWLAGIAPPTIALVNNIAPAHLERMQNLVGIAHTKAALYDALPEDGIAVINADDAFAEFFAARVKGRKVLRFGLEASADVRAREIECTAEGARFVLVTPDGEAVAGLPLPGRHNIANALAAAALALAAGASLDAIVAGLAAAQPVKGRMFRHHLPGGAVLMDDSYNANPGSLSAAIHVLAGISPLPPLAPVERGLPRCSSRESASGASAALQQRNTGNVPREIQKAPTWLILGDMRELGPDAKALHAAAGEEARKAGISRLFALGELSAAAANAFGNNAQRFDAHDALINALHAELTHTTPPPVMLIKGSRGSAMERIVNALLPAKEAADAA